MSGSSNAELPYQIALTIAPAIGPVTARKLISKAGSACEVFRMSRASLEKIPSIGPLLSQSIKGSALMKQAEMEMEFLEKHHISALYFEDEQYPARLKECDDAPILLYTKGNNGLHAKHALSVVGTRKASSYGKEICRSIILDLGSMISDLVIISGLAFGIDVIAHRVSLEGGIPTVAVLGHGFTTLYPHAHRETARKICGRGALVTDFHSGIGPERNNFLRRNRIIAGLADATLVVESPRKGGALITADMASSYQREDLAVPGRVTDERSKGCNRLIRKNAAAMVESAKDIIDQLNWNDDIIQAPEPVSEIPGFSAREKQLLELIRSHNGLGPGDLSLHSGIPIQEVLSLLTQMELKRWVIVEPGNQYQTLINLSP
jgi:DNA processing protein